MKNIIHEQIRLQALLDALVVVESEQVRERNPLETIRPELPYYQRVESKIKQMIAECRDGLD